MSSLKKLKFISVILSSPDLSGSRQFQEGVLGGYLLSHPAFGQAWMNSE